MDAVWSRPPTDRVTSLGELGGLGEKLNSGGGECLYVCELDRYPGWLYKAYRAVTSAERARRLDQLIALPGQLSATDLAIVDGQTCWPTARVVDQRNQTTGVLLPMAPEAYKYPMKLPGGRSKTKYLEVDILALAGTQQHQRGVPAQTLHDRVAVCASIAATAELLERKDLVYLDWSYANLFWRPSDHATYLIDLDGMSFGPRSQIQTPQWDDPYVPLGTIADGSSDRYRVALLLTSCLTGKRVFEAGARTELSELRQQSAEVEQLAELLLMALTSVPAYRPMIARIKGALDAVSAAATAGRTGPVPGHSWTAAPAHGGVTSWKPIGNTPKANPVSTPSSPRPDPCQPAPAGSTPRSGSTSTSGQRSTASSAAGRSGRSTGSAGRADRGNSRVPQRTASRAATVAYGVIGTVMWIVIIAVAIAIIVAIAHAV